MGRKGETRERRSKRKREEHRAPAANGSAPPSEQGSAALALAGEPASSTVAADDVELDLTDAASLIPEPPTQHVPRTRSGFAPRMPRHDDHRVEMDFEDLSLRPDNPYVASPLVASMQEEPEPRPGLRTAKAAALALLVASSGYGVWAAVRDLGSTAMPHATRAEASSSVPQQSRAPQARKPPHNLTSATPPEPTAQSMPPSTAAPPDPAPPPKTTNAPQLVVDVPPIAAGSPPSAPEAVTRASIAKPPPSPAATGPLPKRPSADALRAGFAAIKPQMRACVAGRRGLVTIRAQIIKSGQISQGSVEGVFQTPDERACMTRAILELRFPRFEQESFSVVFALAL